MNSDPHESAAWRTFGMLDADEAASLDEAVRHDPDLKGACHSMDCLATAVALTMTVPVVPQAGQLQRLHTRLGLNPPKRANWPGITGWAAAAVLTMILAIEHRSNHGTDSAENARTQSVVSDQKKLTAVSRKKNPTLEAVTNGANPPDLEGSGKSGLVVPSQDSEGKTVAKVEAKRLIQEIEVLRGKLENFQKRDRQRFEPVAGMAWPVIMKMAPPETPDETVAAVTLMRTDHPITAMVGDALAQTSGPAAAINLAPPGAALPTPPAAEPSAIPIYDAARDTGTLVVSNLPKTDADHAYNLWVKTDAGANPIYVGQLPKSNDQAAESFDFSLGSTSILPSAFILTSDPQGRITAPSKSNTVLQGPH